MKKLNLLLFLFFGTFCISPISSQVDTIQSDFKKPAKLFRSQTVLPIKLSYSNKVLKNKTNDSTYMKTNFSYMDEKNSWDSLEIEIRARGNFRKNNCYFTPVKISIEKENAKGTLLKGNKKLKLVLPCKTDKFGHDYILKEYLAYKFYEVLSPFSFKTRLVDINYEELRGKKPKNHDIIGFIIEDDKNVAKRTNGKILKSKVHPLEQDSENCVRHAFFQYMIGNIDFSSTYQHNADLIYKDNKIFPVPYDFDMSGLVNTNYSDMLAPQLEKMNIRDVTVRKYRGFTRHIDVFNSIRQEYLDKKDDILQCIEEVESLFNSKTQFQNTKEYIRSFYKILADDELYVEHIVSKARTK
ncbi:hypothetical protein U0L90_09685 [Flavobacteriaceae sp. LMIT009]